MIYIVTGVSRGLGKAIADALLERGDRVIGIGRSTTIEHSSYQFIPCDLSQPEAVQALEIPFSDNEVTLINNAGILGNVGRISESAAIDLEQVLRVNTLAPALLAHKIYRQLKNKDMFTLVNISSGAAGRPIPSWAAYCASKAALNMYTETFYLEERERGHHPKVYALAPGVIDTDMQKQIRETPENNFSAVQNFIDLKENDQLYSGEEAARRLLKLLDLPYDGSVLCDLRNI